MIIKDELTAVWEKEGKILLLTNTYPSKLQHLADNLSDKLSFCQEMNERLLEFTNGNLEKDRLLPIYENYKQE